MTVKEALQMTGLTRLDCEVLLAHTIGKPRTWIASHPEYCLTDAEKSLFNSLKQRRRRHEPIAYITGAKEFYGRAFTVTREVLIPRPATEGLVSCALQFLKDGKDHTETIDEGIVAIARTLKRKPQEVSLTADIGTGSGCIAISLALELPNHHVVATDISSTALAIAKKNAEHHGVTDRIECLDGSALAPLQNCNRDFIVVSNPPYIPAAQVLMPDVADFEPHQALFAGPDGLEVIRKIIEQAKANAHCVGLVLECRTDQLPSIDQLMKASAIT